MTPNQFRVLFLIENVPYSLDTRVRREAHTLMSAGAEVTVICPTDGAGAVRTIDGVRVYQYAKPALGAGFVGHLAEYVVSLFFHALLTAWVALRRGFDVVHVANPPDLLWLVAAPYRLLGKRFVFDHHDLVPELFEVRYRDKVPAVLGVVRWLERMSIRLADHVICTNDTFRAFAMTRGGKPARDVTVVRNGPWLGRDFPQVPRARPEAEAAPARLLVGYIGIMNPQDHVDHLVRAAQIVRGELRRDDIFFLLIGSGDAYESLRTLRDSFDLGSAVEMPGTLPWPEVVAQLGRADLCVQPDPPTRFNRHLTMNKLMEYMALGKAAIAYDMPETRFSGGDAVFYIDDQTPAGLAAAIVRLADDPALRAELGRRARERIENVLSWEHQQATLLSVYRQLLPMSFAPVTSRPS
jgi:glycosyltransferase involved in cell wall biosynthesis